MFSRGRHGCGSLPRLLLALLSLLMAARVQPSPFAEYEGLPFASSFESHFEYDFPKAKALEAAGAANYRPSQKASLDSTKNLQQILRSFPLVVGGHVPPPSSSSPYDVWRSFQEGVEGDHRPLSGGSGAAPARGRPSSPPPRAALRRTQTQERLFRYQRHHENAFRCHLRRSLGRAPSTPRLSACSHRLLRSILFQQSIILTPLLVDEKCRLRECHWLSRFGNIPECQQAG
ncbi:hypothetical protein C7M84_012464 [Penaeus vannamei]|uniref:Uncharacterized protein n=1 Tax=Penaeus vannamei TaxID=6689 RepID=A0A3R7M1M8_PENVA|nr:hypothetical protein C7M84_012464 [Penaeus vannamei]